MSSRWEIVPLEPLLLIMICTLVSAIVEVTPKLWAKELVRLWILFCFVFQVHTTKNDIIWKGLRFIGSKTQKTNPRTVFWFSLEERSVHRGQASSPPVTFAKGLSAGFCLGWVKGHAEPGKKSACNTQIPRKAKNGKAVCGLHAFLVSKLYK